MPLETCASNPFAVGNIASDPGTSTPPVISRIFEAAAGAFAFTGTAATLSTEAILSAGAAAYTFTGAAATLQRSDIAVNADAGTFTFTGTAATLIAPSWVDAVSVSMSATSASWAGNLRQLIPAANVSTSGNRARITFKGGATGTENASVGACYIGHGAPSGDAFDFESSPTQVLVGASGTFTVNLNTEVVSDEITFSVDETKPLLISVFFNSAANDTVGSSVPGFGTAYFKGGADDSTTVNATGYSGSAGFRLVRRVEVRTI